MILLSENKIKVLSIAGPTASGKTALSVSLALRMNGEIVSADSMQIYKGMDIATAKPFPEERKGISHHLMDFIDQDDIYSVARYVSDAAKVIRDIHLRCKLPIIVGGTGLYIDSLLNGIAFCEGEVDLKLRKTLMDKLDTVGIDAMLSELFRIDPQTAEKFSIERNPKRIVRAFEVFYSTGVTFSKQNELSKLNESEFEPVKIALNYRNREHLYERINNRVDMMISQGLVEEARKFYSMNLSDTSKQAIGYKELKPYLDNEKSLDECIDTLKRSTRRYAKRQLTWFNRDKNIRWFFPDDYINNEKLLDDVILYLQSEGFVFHENF